MFFARTPIVEEEVDQDSFLRVVQDSETYEGFKAEKKTVLHGIYIIP